MHRPLALAALLVFVPLPAALPAQVARRDDPEVLRAAFILGQAYAMAIRVYEKADESDEARLRRLEERLEALIASTTRELGIPALLPAYRANGERMNAPQALVMLGPGTGRSVAQLRATYGRRTASAFAMGMGVELAATGDRDAASGNAGARNGPYARFGADLGFTPTLYVAMERAFSPDLPATETKAATDAFVGATLRHLEGLTPHNQVAALRRLNIWELGAALSMVSTARMQMLSGDVVYRYWEQASAHALPLGVRIPPVFDPHGSVGEAGGHAIAYLLGVGDSIAPQIRRNYGDAAHALFEMGLKSLLPLSMWPRDDERRDADRMGFGLESIFERTGPRSGLPEELWMPFVRVLKDRPAGATVRTASAQMRERIGSYLEARAP